MIALGAAALACGPKAPQFTEADRTANRAEADSFTARVLRKDWAGASALFAADARFMPPNEKLVSGRKAIETWMGSFPPIKTFKLTIDAIDGSGDLAYVAGHYSMSVTPPGAPGPVSDNGKYLNVRQRQSDGSWLTVADEFNSDNPPMAPASSKKAAPAKKPASKKTTKKK
ncbi:MAG TPA: nuclear transport factor 2 family protein [Gemmatimonadales bacterium]|nr:nuclear transport factor 2 family protein [Gemmatimonadales bacterium]